MRKFKVWLDSGANIHSMKTQEVTLEELGYTDDEWDSMEDWQKEKVMFEVIMNWGECGYAEV